MDSIIKKSEVVDNTDRHFGSNLKYYPCYIEAENGTKAPALFTADDIEDAINRAAKNSEDIPEPENFWGKLFG